MKSHFCASRNYPQGPWGPFWSQEAQDTWGLRVLMGSQESCGPQGMQVS